MSNNKNPLKELIKNKFGFIYNNIEESIYLFIFALAIVVIAVL